jgi:hypothetical protein
MAMGTTKQKVAAVLVLAVGLAGGGAALSGQRTPSPAQPATEDTGVPNPPPSDRAADDPRPGQAEKDFRLAEFYRRTSHAGTAYFYYQLVCRRYPGTKWAARAAERLGELRKKADEGTKAEEKRPARVGQIIVVGNTRTEQSVILEQLQLYPGQVLTPAELRAAERRLERLNATVSAIDSEGSDYKDILIRVREK